MLSWCDFSSKIGIIWTIFYSDQRTTQEVETQLFMWHKQPYPRTHILLEGNNQRQNTSGKNAMSASYCFLTCSILGNEIFSSGIHLNCVITTPSHLNMGRRPPKVYCCSKMKGRKGQLILPPALPSFTIFSCLTINTTPETEHVHSD